MTTRKTPKKAYLIKVIEDAQKRQSSFAESIKDSENPQLVKMRIDCEGRAAAYGYVLDAMKNGQTFDLLIDAYGS